MIQLDELRKKISGKNTKTVLKEILDQFKERAAFATSFSIEDQVITHLIASINKNAKIFTLDTGRLPYETYKLIELTNERYDINVEIFFPDFRLVQEMVNAKGINLFYNSVEDRKLCCRVRKIEPLKHALNGLDVWITGLRREQSVTRENVSVLDYDETNGLLKLNPLFDWTEDMVWDFIKKNNVPYNNLYNQGYTSIGCAPCTRAVKAGETVRDGRWWWENPETKECGLHFSAQKINEK